MIGKTMRLRWRGEWLIGVLVVLWLTLAHALPAQGPLTHVQDTVYHANGTVAAGTVLVSWPAFTTSTGQTVARGNTSTTLSASGVLSISLAPNAGSAPAGTYYTAVYHLDDGSVSREYWAVPAASGTVTLQQVRASVLPASVAMQTASTQYVDSAIAHAVAAGSLPADPASFVSKSGDTMAGPLVLSGDPSSSLQASTKNYVDTNVAALQAGLGQKIATIPVGTQTVTQPAGTQLRVNNLNNEFQASQYKTPTRNDGVAKIFASPDCTSGCEVVIDHSYTGMDGLGAGGAPNATHGVDHRGGVRTEFFYNPLNPSHPGANAAEDLTVVDTQKASDLKTLYRANLPYSFGLRIRQMGLAGGNNILATNVSATMPYFKSTYHAVSLEGMQSTLGQHVLDAQFQNCFGVGDCLMGARFLKSSGGFRDNADEGTHPYDFLVAEDERVFTGACATGCSAGSTSMFVTATGSGGTQGEGRFLLDMNPSKAISTGQLTGGNRAGAPFPTVVFTGTSFPISTFFQLQAAIPPQATNMAPGTVTVALQTSGVPADYQANTAAAPASSGVACVVDNSPGGTFNANNYEMANYTVVDGTHLQLSLLKPHAAGATVAIGGLCGYGLEQTVDTVAGVRQVFPVVGSTSATQLYYASGPTNIVGYSGFSSAYLNVNLGIASIARSSGAVTVTTTGALPADLNGLNLTVAGVADASFNGTFAVTTTGPNTLSYTQAGANATSASGTIGILTGGFNLYPMAEVLTVINQATRDVDGTMTLAPNTVNWEANDPVEQPHYFAEKVYGGMMIVSQQTPAPVTPLSAGVQYQNNVGPSVHGWVISNLASASSYFGSGGTHTPPAVAIQTTGIWSTAFDAQAGEQSLFTVHCNSHGCGKWNSAYKLFSLDSGAGAGAFDSMTYSPQASTLGMNMRGTQYSFSPTAFTAGTINATTINATTINGLPAVTTEVNAVAFSATPVLSSSTRVAANRIVLTGNVTSSTIAAGADGQRMCVNVVQDAAGGRTFAWPANMLGAMTVGTVANKRSHQCFVYYAADAAWLADSAGVANQ
jgi:hypothetical protein